MGTFFNVFLYMNSVYFIIAKFSFLYWLVFRKISLKKTLIHLGASVMIFCVLTGVYIIQCQSANAEYAAKHPKYMPKPVAISTDLLNIITNDVDPESIPPATLEEIAKLASQRLGDAGVLHAQALKKYFVYYHSHVAKHKLPENVAGIEFDGLRRTAERHP